MCSAKHMVSLLNQLSCLILFCSCLCFLLKFSFRYKVSLFSKWKQRGMFATCMWIVQLLLVLSGKDTIFAFVPEYYIDTLVSKSSFHASFMKLVSID